MLIRIYLFQINEEYLFKRKKITLIFIAEKSKLKYKEKSNNRSFAIQYDPLSVWTTNKNKEISLQYPSIKKNNTTTKPTFLQKMSEQIIESKGAAEVKEKTVEVNEKIVEINEKIVEVKEKTTEVKEETVEIKEETAETKEEKYDFSEIEKSEWEINCEHLDIKVQELEDFVDVSDEYSSEKLLNIFDKLDLKKEDFDIWAGYGDSGTVFYGKDDARSKLSSVVSYAESNTSASKSAKHRLRVVTKLLVTDEKQEIYHPTQILLLLAAHGNVCNVQKEVAINSAFSLMTDSMHELVEKHGIEVALYRVLRDYRYLLVEHLYKTFNATNNIHSIVMVSNSLCKKIGIYEQVDPNQGEWDLPNDWRNTAEKKYFGEFYTVSNVVKYVNTVIKEKKLPYQQVITKFEQFIESKVKSDLNIDIKDYTYSFLHSAIDTVTGDFKPKYLCWFLSHFNVLKKYTGESVLAQRLSFQEFAFFVTTLLFGESKNIVFYPFFDLVLDGYGLC
ncbi:hypothetical protein RFI_21748 [Reticulomyxa filosa]|uniref:Uncharacterized protein n=1 Tax=Reticulomyxa filosa TaxID=46433 RepID=X6MR91_RETFI|nr:hypothetical protein RFI_21748 [Reticulomyxa filosa]|eukprot:ETO15620.1 hypothetical protein RFI_21748 [Reticulomyxa filosa]